MPNRRAHDHIGNFNVRLGVPKLVTDDAELSELRVPDVVEQQPRPTEKQ